MDKRSLPMTVRWQISGGGRTCQQCNVVKAIKIRLFMRTAETVRSLLTDTLDQAPVRGCSSGGGGDGAMMLVTRTTMTTTGTTNGTTDATSEAIQSDTATAQPR